MIFNEKKVAFGRHETFPLRYGWLTKGYQELKNNPHIFTSDDATIKLGVGKNMVNAIRYWLQAAQIAQATSYGLQISKLGEAIFDIDGFDPFLEDEATIWLIHWLLASNPTTATSWYWFFNCFHKPEFVNKEVYDGLYSFSQQKISAKFTPSTLKKDVDIILRMYAGSKINNKQPFEDTLDSPLSQLNLVIQSPITKSYYSPPEERIRIPLGVLGFVVASLFKETNKETIPIENLMYMKGSTPALGSIFRLTENALLARLESLELYIPNQFKISETAGIHQLVKISEDYIDPLIYLNKHYCPSFEVAA